MESDNMPTRVRLIQGYFIIHRTVTLGQDTWNNLDISQLHVTHCRVSLV